MLGIVLLCGAICAVEYVSLLRSFPGCLLVAYECMRCWGEVCFCYILILSVVFALGCIGAGVSG